MPPDARPDLRATYRLQLHAGFDLDAAAAAVPYLARLGVSHVYTSPVLRAAPGSTHGYDVVDHDAVDEQLGGWPAMDRLRAALAEHGLGLVVDVVPNHMSTSMRNRRWRDVLRFGRTSPYARWFDLRWGHGSAEVPDRVLLPLLGDHYGTVLRAGDLRLDRDPDGTVVQYFEHRVPLRPESEVELLLPAVGDHARLGPLLGELDLANGQADHERAVGTLGAVGAVLADEPAAAAAVDAHLAAISADRDALHEVLERQHHRLARWQLAGRELDYRRFFDITGLIGLRVEEPDVFEASHRVLLDGVRDGWIDGLRIDHPDGLSDPTGYLERLRDAAPSSWIVVEKILVGDEQLPAWPCDGTTGYESTIEIGDLFVDPAGEADVSAAFRQYTGEHRTAAEIRRSSKRRVIDELLPGEVTGVVRALREHLGSGPDRLDLTDEELRPVVEALLVEFPVYRTYLRPGQEPSETDVAVVRRAVAAARGAQRDVDGWLLDVVERTLLGPDARGPVDGAADFVRRFQQLTGPVMAKGVEDTVFYRDTRLVALNEVGGLPGRFGSSLERFHAAQVRAAASHPLRMVTTSTHDTKRSEDVRARIAVLSEIGPTWRAWTIRWGERCAAIAVRLGIDRDPVLELLVHQTLVGAWPLTAERAHEYLTKAAREAKRTTSWLRPDEGAEAALHRMLDELLGDDQHQREVAELVAEIDATGRVHALAQKLLALTVPGVPDLYQGSELWTDGLVDPDNRRPVDYARRAALLDAPPPVASGDVAVDGEGAVKLRLVRDALALRRRRPGAFTGPAATYEPLLASGGQGSRVVAFVRGGEVVVVVPRLVHGLATRGGWDDTAIELPAGRWVDALDPGEGPGTPALEGGRSVDVRELLGHRPVRLLERVG